MADNSKPTTSFQYAAIGEDDEQSRERAGAARGFWTPWAGFGWYFECFCILTSFLCIGAICIILIRMDNRAAQDWTFRFSINATVAALATVFKMAAATVLASCLSQMKWLHFKASARQLRDLDLFDAASRGGPWGAALILWYSLRRWSSLTAAVAAVATILALSTDIAVQQLVGSDPRSISVDQNATFPISLSYNGGTQSDASHGGSNFYPKASTADIKMQGAIYNGIFNISTAPIYSCPSTCVWNMQPYYSLGFSSSCVNVTGSMAVNASSQGYSVMTPSNISISANYSFTAYQAVINVKAVDLTSYGSKGDVMPAEFLRVGILKSPVVDDVNYSIDPASLEGFECTVAFSGYTYVNASANGTLFSIGESKATPLVEGIVTASNSSVDDLVVVFNQTELPTMTARVPDVGAITQFFTSDRFSGAIYDGEGVPSDPQGVGAALLNADVDDAFSAMADSMTAQLRQSTDSTLAEGITLNQVAFVHVRWYYLALPLTVQLLSLGLLIRTWYQNRKGRVRLWKDSTVAVLYHNVSSSDGRPDRIHTDVKSTEQLDVLAKRATARLD